MKTLAEDDLNASAAGSVPRARLRYCGRQS
jgi:hypothetical protein